MSHHDPYRAVSTHDDTPGSTDAPGNTDAPTNAPAPTGAPTAAPHHDHLNSMRLPDLRALATDLGLEPTGRRDILIDRIRDHQTTASPDA